jgi:hypothetical protein
MVEFVSRPTEFVSIQEGRGSPIFGFGHHCLLHSRSSKEPKKNLVTLFLPLLPPPPYPVLLFRLKAIRAS